MENEPIASAYDVKMAKEWLKKADQYGIISFLHVKVCKDYGDTLPPHVFENFIVREVNLVAREIIDAAMGKLEASVGRQTAYVIVGTTGMGTNRREWIVNKSFTDISKCQAFIHCLCEEVSRLVNTYGRNRVSLHARENKIDDNFVYNEETSVSYRICSTELKELDSI